MQGATRAVSVGRSDKNGLDARRWTLMILWQLSYLHPNLQKWEWSLKEIRFLYEWSETTIINIFWILWTLNICKDGWHVGHVKSILLDDLFCRSYDLSTYPGKFLWLACRAREKHLTRWLVL
jgi:hypothetical protein